MFTIEVIKIEKDKKFGFDNLRMFHQQCYGGEVIFEWVNMMGYYHFECLRCGETFKVKDELEKKVKFKITQTAIDGKKRRLMKGLSVIQKT